VIQVTRFQVRSFDLDHLDLSWELADTGESPLDWKFEILKSLDGPEGPFNLLAETHHNQYLFRDPDVSMLHKWRSYYYKLRLTGRQSGESIEFGPEWLRAEPDRIALEVARREQLLFREFAGRKAVLFPALTSGERCGNCFYVAESGNYTGRPHQQSCQSCFDTSFVGGYAKPIIIHIQFDPSTQMVQRSDLNERAQVDSTARMSSYPPVKPKDMLVDAENKRWQVETVTPTRKLGAIVRQELRVHQIPTADVRYRIVVEIDQPSPEREFTRPMDVHSLSSRER
jgi:hypothetical protein